MSEPLLLGGGCLHSERGDGLGWDALAVAKKTANKISVVGRKYALRRLSEDGTAMAESSDSAFRR